MGIRPDPDSRIRIRFHGSELKMDLPDSDPFKFHVCGSESEKNTQINPRIWRTRFIFLYI